MNIEQAADLYDMFNEKTLSNPPLDISNWDTSAFSSVSDFFVGNTPELDEKIRIAKLRHQGRLLQRPCNMVMPTNMFKGIRSFGGEHF